MSMRINLSAWADALSSWLDQWKLDHVDMRFDDQESEVPQAYPLLLVF
jgi:hypothetical protein